MSNGLVDHTGGRAPVDGTTIVPFVRYANTLVVYSLASLRDC